MGRYAVSTTSITYALKGRDLLRKKGFSAYTERKTTGLSGVGCGYNIIFSGDRKQAMNLLSDAGVKTNGIIEL